MADYHFVTVYRLEAPIGRVWETLRDFRSYPIWSKGIFHAQQLQAGAAAGEDGRIRFKVRRRLPFTLAFDATVTRTLPPRLLELRAVGELEGVGRWTLWQEEAVTTARYTWDVCTTKRWMNLLAPLARPVFAWNHDGVMREAGHGLARHLGTRLLGIETGLRPGADPAVQASAGRS
jgi:Polyketide cyclase / dehydrase and lipid transport